MNTRIVGFNSGHDASYCILENGIPVICEEFERVGRVKMELGDGLKLFFERSPEPEKANYFAFGNWGNRSGKGAEHCRDPKSQMRMKKILAQNDGKFFEFGHHLSHGANAFYSSDFEEALIVTMDGGGNEDKQTETAFTISRGVGNKIERIKIYPDKEINLGQIWSFITGVVMGLSLGFPKGHQAGIVMAMGALGDAKYVPLFSNFEKNLAEFKLIAATSEKEKFNIAASLQEYTESEFRRVVTKYIGGNTNLCVSGGVALNCVMLGKIKKWFPEIKNIFCDPMPYDGGLALGAARYLWHHVLGNPRLKKNLQITSPYLGKAYSEEEVKKACSQDHLSGMIKLKRAKDREVLDRISEQKIVAVFGGGSESGRRALGNRSILADPRNPSMKSLINEKVKHRQWYRPVAPAILEEKVSDWFENPMPSPYMSFALKFKNEQQDKVPAVVHYDGTGRLQTVNKSLSPWFYNFLTQWDKISGVPILANTSFNDSEPIVETPEDALSCFLRTEIDYLYFYDYGILVSQEQ